MPYKNIKEVLVDATKLPAAIEAKLPEGAPKISTMLKDAAEKIPAGVPDFPMEIPDLPAVPELPAGGGFPGLKRYVKVVEVKPVGQRVIIPLSAAVSKPLGEEILS